MLRVTAIEPGSVTLTTGNVSLRRFAPASPASCSPWRRSRFAGARRRPRSRRIWPMSTCWSPIWASNRPGPGIGCVAGSRCAATGRLGRRARDARRGLAARAGPHPRRAGPARPGRDHTCSPSSRALRPADVAHRLRELPEKRRIEVAVALDDERLADVVQELPDDDQVDLLSHLEVRPCRRRARGDGPRRRRRPARRAARDRSRITAAADGPRGIRAGAPIARALPRHRGRSDDARNRWCSGPRRPSPRRWPASATPT